MRKKKLRMIQNHQKIMAPQFSETHYPKSKNRTENHPTQRLQNAREEATSLGDGSEFNLIHGQTFKVKPNLNYNTENVM